MSKEYFTRILKRLEQESNKKHKHLNRPRLSKRVILSTPLPQVNWSDERVVDLAKKEVERLFVEAESLKSEMAKYDKAVTGFGDQLNKLQSMSSMDSNSIELIKTGLKSSQYLASAKRRSLKYIETSIDDIQLKNQRGNVTMLRLLRESSK